MNRAGKFLLQLWQKERPAILIFCLVFGIRFVYTLLLQVKLGGQAFTANSDAEAFTVVARNILEHGAFSQMTTSPWLPDGLRTPLFPFLIAAFIWANIPLLGLVLLQNILAGVTGVLLFKLGIIIFKNKLAGALAALLYGFEPTAIFWNSLLMSDNIFVFLLVLAWYLFAKKRYLGFAFALGLATLERPVGLYLFPLFLVLFIYLNRAHFPLKKFIAVLFIFVLTIAPWVIRNKIVFNTFELASAGWWNLHVFTSGNFARQQNIPLPWPAMPAGYAPAGTAADMAWLYDFRNLPFYKDVYFDLLRQYPLAYAKFHLAAMAQSLTNHDYEYLLHYVIGVKLPGLLGNVSVAFLLFLGNALWLVFYALALLGLFFRAGRPWKIFLIGFVLWNNFLLGYAGVNWGGRYNLPVAPMIFLLAGVGAGEWRRLIYERYGR